MKGFTLIETMVAITILTFAMAGPLFTAGRAIVAAQTARDQLTASYLAQEGIEYVRVMRDNAYLAAYSAGGTDIAGTAWSNFLTGLGASSIARCIAPSMCTLDTRWNTLGQCSGDSCAPLRITGCVNGDGGIVCTSPNIYTQNVAEGIASPFTRTIQAVTISATEEKIVSTVSWNFHNIPYSVAVSDHLTAWQ